MLSIVFACARFHQFIFGSTAETQTDHKPLVSLSKKPLCDCPLRVQRLLLRVQQHDLRVQETPGKYFITADTLSRSKPTSSMSKTEESIEEHVDMVMEYMPMSDQCLQDVQRETAKVQELLAVTEEALKGWPNNKTKCSQEVMPCWNVRDELSMTDGILLKRKPGCDSKINEEKKDTWELRSAGKGFEVSCSAHI